MSGRRCSRALRAYCSRRHAPAMADARAARRCERQRSACLRGMVRYHAAREGAQGAFGFNSVLVDPAAKMGRKHVDARERPSLVRPGRLIGFAAVQQIEFGEPLFNGRANAQVEYGTAEAVRLTLGIVAVLIEVEPPL